MNAITRPQGWTLTYDNAEALKWLAFASMLVDHASKVFGPWDWAQPIGRIAFPVFAFLIGRHLGSERMLHRLLLVGALATVPHGLTLTPGHVLPLNILFTFAFAAGVLRLLGEGRNGYAAVLFGLGVLVCDYSLPGLALVLASWAWWQSRAALAVLLLALALVLLCAFNGNTFALLAVPLVLVAGAADWRVPRVRHVFWFAYPLHLALLAALAWWGVGASPLR